MAEGTVKYASTWVIAALRDQKFFSEIEIQQAVAQKLEELNDKPFQKREGTRRSAYLLEEKEFMLPLNVSKYEPAVWTQSTVSNDYLISDGKNKYSVPFDLIGEEVQIRITKTIIEVFFHSNRVASHQREMILQRNPIIKVEHMTPEHRKYLNYNADDFAVWAAKIGEQAAEVVRYFLACGTAPEQGYKACVSLTKLAERYGDKRLELACEQILKYSAVPSLRNIAMLLKNNSTNPSKTSVASKNENSNSHGITRGANYFSKGGDCK